MPWKRVLTMLDPENLRREEIARFKFVKNIRSGEIVTFVNFSRLLYKYFILFFICMPKGQIICRQN